MRSTFRRLSIRRKLTLLMTLISVVSLLAAVSAFVAYEYMSFRGQMTVKLGALAEVIGASASAAVDFDDYAGAQESLAPLRVDDHVMSACLYARHDSVLATYTRPGAEVAVESVGQNGSPFAFTDQ